jgi:L-asparaginase / beta-aspartyl-peptidase
MAIHAQTNIILAIHGGAGTLFKGRLTPEREQGAELGLNKALEAGYQVWLAGGNSLDMVEAAVRELEDCEFFNAGRGSVFSHEGKQEMDAAIMEGTELQAGAVAGVSTIKNPIGLARRVLTASAHVLLTGPGAESFAQEQGIPTAPPEYFFTDYRWQQLLQIRESSATALDHSLTHPLEHTLGSEDIGGEPSHFGTVGAVARDAQNSLAAATSTGGMTNKRWGRIGDSPLIGSGTYADNRSCAVSATGHGEYLMRTVMGHEIASQMRIGGKSLTQAGQAALAELARLGGEGGLIALDASGNCILPFNTGRMYRGWLAADGQRATQIYE